MNNVSGRLGKGRGGEKHVNDFDAWYVKGYNWAARSASLRELEMLRKYFVTSRRKVSNLYNPSPELAVSDKSLLTMLIRGNRLGNPRDLSPLDAIGFIEGALEWRLQRNRLQRLRRRKKDRLEKLALPDRRQDSSKYGQALACAPVAAPRA